MKKNVLAFLMLLLAVSAFAQFSVGGTFMMSVGAGTELNEESFKKAVEKFGEFTQKPACDGVVNAFVRYSHEKMKKFGAEFDVSYFNGNGIREIYEASESNMIFQYKYRSVDLVPMLTYELNTKPVLFTFMAGPNFSFPVGKVEYEYKYFSENSDDYDCASFFVPGITGGFTVGYKKGNVEAFLKACYTNDFLPVEYEINDKSYELLTRRTFTAGFGIRFIIPSKSVIIAE